MNKDYISFSSCHFKTPCNSLMYLIDNFNISLLLNFLSEGWVGSKRRNSANAPLTFCCLKNKKVYFESKKIHRYKVKIIDRLYQEGFDHTWNAHDDSKMIFYFHLQQWAYLQKMKQCDQKNCASLLKRGILHWKIKIVLVG